jgi:hypothetical protein
MRTQLTAPSSLKGALSSERLGLSHCASTPFNPLHISIISLQPLNNFHCQYNPLLIPSLFFWSSGPLELVMIVTHTLALPSFVSTQTPLLCAIHSLYSLVVMRAPVSSYSMTTLRLAFINDYH